MSGNTAEGDAGGVWAFAGTVRLDRSRVSHNRARRGGGGIVVGPLDRPQATATVTLDHTPVTGNVAGRRGGGIYVAHGTLKRTASPVKRNRPDDIARAR